MVITHLSILGKMCYLPTQCPSALTYPPSKKHISASSPTPQYLRPEAERFTANLRQVTDKQVEISQAHWPWLCACSY